MQKFDAFEAMKAALRANMNDGNVEKLLNDIKNGTKQIRPTVIGFRRALAAGGVSMIEPDDSLTRGVYGLSEGKLRSDQALLITGFQLRAAYHATVAFTPANVSGAFFTHLEDTTSNTFLANGFFDFSIGSKVFFKETSMAMFANKGTTERAGYYALDTPNIFGKPGETLDFEVKGIAALTNNVALSLEIYGVHTI